MTPSPIPIGSQGEGESLSTEEAGDACVSPGASASGSPVTLGCSTPIPVSGTSGPLPPTVGPVAVPGGAADRVGALGTVGVPGSASTPGIGTGVTGAAGAVDGVVVVVVGVTGFGARGATGTGKALPEIGASTWPVTQTGVWLLEPE